MPAMTRERTGLIGPGRLGSALAVALARCGEAVTAVYGHRRECAEALAGHIFGCMRRILTRILDGQGGVVGP